MFGFSEKILDKSGLEKFTSRKDYLGPLVCGFTSGAVFKSTGKIIFLKNTLNLYIAGPRGALVSGLIGMGVVAAIRFTQNTLLPKMGMSKRRSHVLFI